MLIKLLPQTLAVPEPPTRTPLRETPVPAAAGAWQCAQLASLANPYAFVGASPGVVPLSGNPSVYNEIGAFQGWTVALNDAAYVDGGFKLVASSTTSQASPARLYFALQSDPTCMEERSIELTDASAVAELIDPGPTLTSDFVQCDAPRHPPPLAALPPPSSPPATRTCSTG